MGNSNASMSNVDTRQVNRDSLFLLAQVRVDGQDAVHRVKVRNLSAGGMMAEGEAKVMRGALVMVELRNIGWVEGSVAWNVSGIDAGHFAVFLPFPRSKNSALPSDPRVRPGLDAIG